MATSALQKRPSSGKGKNGGITGAIVPPRKPVDKFPLMTYVSKNCSFDDDSAGSSLDEESLKMINNHRVETMLKEAAQSAKPQVQESSDDEKKKALEMLHSLEFARNLEDTWKVASKTSSTKTADYGGFLHPLKRSDKEDEYFSGTRKIKQPKERKRTRSDEVVCLENGQLVPKVGAPSQLPIKFTVPPRSKTPTRVPSYGLPFTPAPPPETRSVWQQRSGSALFSHVQTNTIVAYGIDRSEEADLARAIAESLRTAKEEQTRTYNSIYEKDCTPAKGPKPEEKQSTDLQPRKVDDSDWTEPPAAVQSLPVKKTVDRTSAPKQTAKVNGVPSLPHSPRDDFPSKSEFNNEALKQREKYQEEKDSISKLPSVMNKEHNVSVSIVKPSSENHNNCVGNTGRIAPESNAGIQMVNEKSRFSNHKPDFKSSEYHFPNFNREDARKKESESALKEIHSDFCNDNPTESRQECNGQGSRREKEQLSDRSLTPESDCDMSVTGSYRSGRSPQLEEFLSHSASPRKQRQAELGPQENAPYAQQSSSRSMGESTASRPSWCATTPPASIETEDVTDIHKPSTSRMPRSMPSVMSGKGTYMNEGKPPGSATSEVRSLQQPANVAVDSEKSGLSVPVEEHPTQRSFNTEKEVQSNSTVGSVPTPQQDDITKLSAVLDQAQSQIPYQMMLIHQALGLPLPTLPPTLPNMPSQTPVSSATGQSPQEHKQAQMLNNCLPFQGLPSTGMSLPPGALPGLPNLLAANFPGASGSGNPLGNLSSDIPGMPNLLAGPLAGMQGQNLFSFPGIPNSFQGLPGQPGNLPGVLPGVLPDGLPGSFPGGLAGGLPGGIAGGLPGGLAGGLPGGLAGGLPGLLPNGLPGFPFLTPGLTGLMGLPGHNPMASRNPQTPSSMPQNFQGLMAAGSQGSSLPGGYHSVAPGAASAPGGLTSGPGVSSPPLVCGKGRGRLARGLHT